MRSRPICAPPGAQSSRFFDLGRARIANPSDREEPLVQKSLEHLERIDGFGRREIALVEVVPC
jgi:hypothetical protein